MGFTGKDVTIHVDPAFLFDKNEWNEIVRFPQGLKKQKYILLYWASRKMKNHALRIAKANNMKVFDISDGIKKGKFQNIRGISPQEFLGMIKHAEYVCTTSFHGLVFSIIFHIPFCVDIQDESFITNRRQWELLNKLQLLERNIKLNPGIGIDKLDWDHVDWIIHGEKIKSKQYINEVINGYGG